MKQPSDSTPAPELYGFMHIAMHGDWKNIVAEQFAQMHASGLLRQSRRIFVSLVGPDPGIFKSSLEKVHIVHVGHDFTEFEFPTLEFLRRQCHTHSGLVYYVHTKGAFRDNVNTRDWRKYMEYFVLERYQDCTLALESFDVCGVNWLTEPVPHFSGNFWWARAEYIRTLPPLRAMRWRPERYCCEMWIGSNPKVAVKCLHHSHVDHSWARYERALYAAKPGEPSPDVPSKSELSATSEVSVTLVQKPKECRHIVGFMHVAMVNHWQVIVEQQLAKMHASGLWDETDRIYVGLVGGTREDFGFQDDKLEVLFASSDMENGERPTLAALQDFFRDAKYKDSLAYYVHTKGVTHKTIGPQQWRNHMEHFILLRYKECLNALESHDVCGINWVNADWCRLFGGNFWWARGDYIRTLPDVRTLPLISGRDASPRHACERWIGENPSVRAACLHDSRTDHYANVPYPRSRYAALREVPLHDEECTSEWRGLQNVFQDFLEPVYPIKNVCMIGLRSDSPRVSIEQALPRAKLLCAIENLGEYFASTPVVLPRGRTGTTTYVNVDHLTKCDDQKRFEVIYIDADAALVIEVWVKWAREHLTSSGCILFHGTSPGHAGSTFFRELPGSKAQVNLGSGLGAWYNR